MSGRVYTALGLMSGTSMDGIDGAIIATDGERVEKLGACATLDYGDGTREKLRDAAVLAARHPDKSDPHPELVRLEREITDDHVIAVGRLLEKAQLGPAEIDVIGLHGHTVLHRPHRGMTWQIGDGARLARETGIPVVGDMRANDLANGGEGAPFAPLYHRALLTTQPPHNTVAVLNLGGVANVTWVGGLKTPKAEIMAFDTGPGNALIDDWAMLHTGRAVDQDGNLAAQGLVHSELVASFLDNPYFDESPPKSLDRNDFSIQCVRGLSAADGAATLIEITVSAITTAQAHFPSPPEAWYVCGGGRKNKTMMKRLRSGTPVLVDPVEVLGWRGDVLEAEAFGFLAVRSLLGLPLSLPTTTGVSEPVTGGVLHKPG